MSTLHNKSLDSTDWAILQALQQNGRVSYRELGQQIGLSTPAVSERVRKLEESGVITGYKAQLDLDKLGRSIIAFMSVKTTPDKNSGLIELLQNSPHILEAHYITGDASFILKLAVSSIKEMEQAIQAVSHYGATSTSIVMSTHVDEKILSQPKK